MEKLMMFGLGAVGRSFLKKYVKTEYGQPENIVCVEADPSALEFFEDCGCLRENFHTALLNEGNILDYLNLLDPGDYLIDFANNIRSLDVLDWALKNEIHYISLADAGWDDDPDECNGFRPRFLEYKKIKEAGGTYKNTSIVMYGMNPGLVSAFVKKCISEIIINDDSPYMRENRDRFTELFEQRKWKELSGEMDIESVIEVDNDDQVFDVRPEDGAIYSPWCPESYRFESLAPTELLLGTGQNTDRPGNINSYEPEDMYVRLNECALDCPEYFYSPQGMTTGLLTSHEELFTINDMLSSKEHRVTTAFIYSSCDLAADSLKRNRSLKSPEYRLLSRDVLVRGGESVGIIIQGGKFKPRYFGNFVDSLKLKDETATVYQVSSSALSALLYIRSHPSEGFLFPEDLDTEEVLDTASAYLGSYISCECPGIRLKMGRPDNKR